MTRPAADADADAVLGPLIPVLFPRADPPRTLLPHLEFLLFSLQSLVVMDFLSEVVAVVVLLFGCALNKVSTRGKFFFAACPKPEKSGPVITISVGLIPDR